MAVNPSASSGVIQSVDASALAVEAVGADGIVPVPTPMSVTAAPAAITTTPKAARLAPGFTEAFDALYLGAYRTAYRLLGNRQESEDVAQEACARACLRWSRLDDPGAWVGRVSANLALDRWRRLQTAARHRALRIDLAMPEDARRIDLHRALETLPGRQRQVIVLRYLADLTEEQTAAALGCAVGTVKSHASRGLAALRTALGESEGT
jgi:RNA polymerase sigma-70 factor (sigma-E family)